MIEICNECGGTGQTFNEETYGLADCSICGGIDGANKKMTDAWKRDVSDPHYIDRLRDGLVNKSMSQAEFARKCGCSPSRISALLNRKYAVLFLNIYGKKRDFGSKSKLVKQS